MMASPESITRARLIGHGITLVLCMLACAYVGP